MPLAWKHIIVPVDFSECSQAALDYAAGLGRAVHASIEVVHVFEKPYYHGAQHMIVRDEKGEHTSVVELFRKAAVRELEAFMEASRRRGIVATERLIAGDPESEIIAASEQCDVLVMGTHGRHGPARWLLGSIAARVLRGAKCPVLTIRGPLAPVSP